MKIVWSIEVFIWGKGNLFSACSYGDRFEFTILLLFVLMTLNQ
jgi:hypothetical protein